MTTTYPDTVKVPSIMPGPASIVHPPAPYFPRMFWIVVEGKTISADETEVQALVDAGRGDLDIASQDPGSTWTKPAALGFVAKLAPPVLEPTPVAHVRPPALPTDWPTPEATPAKPSGTPRTDAATQPKPREPAPGVPRAGSPGSTVVGEPLQPFALLDFAMALVTGDQTGTKFRLANGGIMASPIPEAGVPLTADIVRQALGQVEKEYQRRGLEQASMNLTEIQEAVVVLAAVLNFQAKLNRGPVSRYLVQFAAAVADFQQTLHIVINSSED